MIPGSSAGAASSFLEELPLLFTAALLKDILEIQNGGRYDRTGNGQKVY
jgi:hypothetical protein